MGKIVASYLLKVHLHAPDVFSEPTPGGDFYPPEPPTNEDVKAAVIAGLEKELGGEITVSLIERTDD